MFSTHHRKLEAELWGSRMCCFCHQAWTCSVSSRVQNDWNILKETWRASQHSHCCTHMLIYKLQTKKHVRKSSRQSLVFVLVGLYVVLCDDFFILPLHVGRTIQHDRYGNTYWNIFLWDHLKSGSYMRLKELEETSTTATHCYKIYFMYFSIIQIWESLYIYK